MSTRLKVFLIITAIVLAITASSMIISISSAQGQILKTLESELEKNVPVANEYISGIIDNLKVDGGAVAQALIGYPDYLIREIMREQIMAYEDFSAIAMYKSSGSAVTLMASEPTSATFPPDEVIRGEYGQKAFRGERVISTSYRDSTGQMVFYVLVPMDDPHNPSILALKVSGEFFSERLKQFKGHLTIVDKEGTVIVDSNEDWVINQLNFPALKVGDPKYEDIARVIERMLAASRNEIGIDQYVIKGSDKFEQDIWNVTAFMPITSPENWAIAVSASVADSSYYIIRGMILVSGLIFIGLGMLAAALASGVIAKPFELLKAAEKAKTAFIANMSHDLRIPLNAVVSLSQLSRTRKGLPPDVGENERRIFESGMNILGVVNDLLDISNIESGKFGVISAEYDLPGFISDTANSNLRHIGTKPVVLNIIPDANLPAKLIGDSLRVRQIFNNLLSNAIVHTKAGSVDWRISTERDGEAVWLVSSVTDSGGGIEPEDIEKLFLDYSSQDTQKKRSSRGTGLGLALTKKIVDLMKGTITVESTVGKGTVFTVKLLHKYVTDDVISAEFADKLKNFTAAARKQGDLSEMQRVQLPDARVLVVDDVEINCEVAKGMIEPYGITVDCVLSSQEAVDLVRKGEPRYDAIFLNRWMPEMDGIEAVRIIREEIDGDYAKNVPVIALVANAITGNNAFFMKSGFQSVLSKPISIFRLDEIIRQWVAK